MPRQGRITNTSKGHSKFWEYEIIKEGPSYKMIRYYGPIGGRINSSIDIGSLYTLEQKAAKIIAEKCRDGYRPASMKQCPDCASYAVCVGERVCALCRAERAAGTPPVAAPAPAPKPAPVTAPSIPASQLCTECKQGRRTSASTRCASCIKGIKPPEKNSSESFDRFQLIELE
jgi:hypothetical protein